MSSLRSLDNGCSSLERNLLPVTINHLPPELITHILSFYYSCQPTSPWEVVRLGLVCRGWKDIIETSPELWTKLNAPSGVTYIRNAVTRSGHLPVSLNFDDYSSRMSLDQYLATVDCAASRWGSVEQHFRRAPSSYGALESSTYRSAERVVINCVDDYDDYPPLQPRREPLPLIRLFGGGPAPLTLKELDLRAIAIDLPAMHLSSLSSLALLEVPNLVMEDVLFALTGCPMLASLHLEDLKGVQVPSMARSELIRLENLNDYYYNLPKPALRFLLDALCTPSLIAASIKVTVHVHDFDPDRDNGNIFDPPLRGFSRSLDQLVSNLISVNVNQAESHSSLTCGRLEITFDPAFHPRWEDYLRETANSRIIYSQTDVMDSLTLLLITEYKPHRVHLLLTDADIPEYELTFFDSGCPIRELSLLKRDSEDGYVHVLTALADRTVLFSELEVLRYNLSLGREDLLVEMLKRRYREPWNIDNEGEKLLPL